MSCTHVTTVSYISITHNTNYYTLIVQTVRSTTQCYRLHTHIGVDVIQLTLREHNTHLYNYVSEVLAITFRKILVYIYIYNATYVNIECLYNHGRYILQLQLYVSKNTWQYMIIGKKEETINLLRVQYTTHHSPHRYFSFYVANNYYYSQTSGIHHLVCMHEITNTLANDVSSRLTQVLILLVCPLYSMRILINYGVQQVHIQLYSYTVCTYCTNFNYNQLHSYIHN